MRKLIALTSVVMIVSSVTAASSATAGASGGGLPVTFEKQVVDPVALTFAGTAGGAAQGALQSRFVPGSLSIAGAIWTFSFDWIVTADHGPKSFVARTTGTFDTITGRVVMDGVVTSGWHAGAPVHEEGQLIDSATFTFAGTIEIRPGVRAS